MLVIAEMPSKAELDSSGAQDIDANNDHMMVTMARGNFEGFTKHDVQKTQESRRLQGVIGNPTEREFAGMVHEKLIADCLVTVRNVHDANHFFALTLLTSGAR
jgi:hypothetical protein